MPSQKDSQPQITVDNDKKHTRNHSPSQHNHTSKNNNPQSASKEEELKKSVQMIQQIREKHPDCIPVFYVKHEQSPKQFPSPKIPFILFKKELKIQQAMYNLYTQIEVKGLYFFCSRHDEKENRMKYVILKPGETIEEVYNKYGRNGHLTLIYGDKNIGLGGINRAEKWLVRLLVVLVMFWVFLFAQPVYYAYEENGFTGVWQVFSLIWSRHDRQTHNSQATNNSTTIHSVNPQHQHQQDTIVFTEKDLPPEELQQFTLQQEEKQQILL